MNPNGSHWRTLLIMTTRSREHLMTTSWQWTYFIICIDTGCSQIFWLPFSPSIPSFSSKLYTFFCYHSYLFHVSPRFYSHNASFYPNTVDSAAAPYQNAQKHSFIAWSGHCQLIEADRGYQRDYRNKPDRRPHSRSSHPAIRSISAQPICFKPNSRRSSYEMFRC